MSVTPLTGLFWKCVVRDGTSAGTKRNRASIKPQPDEYILAFEIDNSDFRQRFGVQKVCDAVFFYCCPNSTPMLIFVELKGGHIQEAANQLSESLSAVQKELTRFGLRPQYRAVVVKSGSAPSKTKSLQDSFKKQYGAELVVTGDRDLRKLIERESGPLWRHPNR